MSQHAGMSKALTFMKVEAGKETKNKSTRKGKGTTPTAGSTESKEVKAETPQEKAKNMITKILKDANTCRQDNHKPLLKFPFRGLHYMRGMLDNN